MSAMIVVSKLYASEKDNTPITNIITAKSLSIVYFVKTSP
jgi:hypothetical protein